MNFTTESAAIQEALRIIGRLATPESGNVTISSNGKKIHIQASSETARCSVNIPATVEGKPGQFAVGLNALRDATKGRSSLAIEFSKAMCKIKSGSYRCELATVDTLEVENAEEEKGTKIEFTSDQAQWIKSAVATVSLKPTALLSTFMPLGLKLSKKGAFVSCFDVNHMAFMRSEEMKGDMEFKLPLDTLVAVLDAFGANAFDLELGQSSVKVGNKLVKVVLSLPQEEENELTLKDVIDMAKASREAKGVSLALPKSELLAFMDNSRSVATKERSEIKVKIEDGKLRIGVITVQGSASATIKTKAKNCEFAIDFEYLDEAIRKAGDVVEMTLVKDEFLAVNLKHSTIILSLNQDTE